MDDGQTFSWGHVVKVFHNFNVRAYVLFKLTAVHTKRNIFNLTYLKYPKVTMESTLGSPNQGQITLAYSYLDSDLKKT